MEETISKKPNVISRLKTELKKPFTKNMLMFSLGTIGRDFLYFLFNSFLMTFILFTKTIDNKMLTAVGAIIVVARIFDALNDPIMGGIVENTRTKWGKYKPWQLLGAVLTGAVIISVFCVKLDGWSYIGFLAFAYLMFSITFTMNDISYWGMLPSLTSDEHERNKLTSCAQLLASAGIGLASLLIPLFTTGSLAKWGAPTGYKVIGIISAVLMVLFQLFTILGVKEKPLPPIKPDKSDRLTLKKMFQTIAKNDQLLWCALIMLIFSIGTGVVGGGLLTMYVYFEFGYEGRIHPAYRLRLRHNFHAVYGDLSVAVQKVRAQQSLVFRRYRNNIRLCLNADFCPCNPHRRAEIFGMVCKIYPYCACIYLRRLRRGFLYDYGNQYGKHRGV